MKWMSRKWQINLSLGVAALLLWGGVRLARSSQKSVSRVGDALAVWKASPTDASLYSALEHSLRHAPGRTQAVRGEVAQVLLTLGEADRAEEVAQSSLQLLRNVSPLHAEFAEISLGIAKEEYQEALERSVALKEKISDAASLLYGRNLLRIAFLQAQVGNRIGEMAAWREWEEVPVRDLTTQGLSSQSVPFKTFLGRESL